MLPTDQRPKVTIEDLLRLKRAERPPAEFWGRFESELRQKQLAALLDRRPWWQALLARRTYLPLGATAVLAFTFASVRYFSSVPVAVVSEPTDSTVATTRQVVAPAPVASQLAEAPAVSGVAVAAAPLSDHLPERAADLTPWSAPLPVETPAARSIAANLAAFEQNDPALAQAVLAGRLPVGPNRVPETLAQAGDLAAVAAVASKRSRLLAQFNERHFTPEPQAPELVRERLSRRLADAEYNERFSRVGLKGDQVSLKF